MDRRQEEGSSSQPPRWEGIKHKDVKIPRQTKARDFIKACFTPLPEHRPERVNKEIDEFKKTLQEIDGMLHADYLPKELKDTLEETTRFLMEDFKRSSDQAVHGYGKDGAKGRKDRQEGEESIRDLNKRIQKMSKDLPMWEHIDKFQASIKNAPPSVSNDAISNFEQSVADKVIDDLKEAHKKVLDYYKQPSDLPFARMFPKNDSNRLKNYYEVYRTFSNFSHKWRKIHEVRAKLEATHREDTEYNTQVKQLIGKAINRARDAYKEGLAWLQEPEHFRDGATKDAYEQLEKVGDQLKALSEASDGWKQVHAIQAAFVEDLLSETSKELANRTVDAAKKAYQQFPERYDQGNDWQVPKPDVELLQALVKSDLDAKWYMHNSRFQEHYAGGDKNSIYEINDCFEFTLRIVERKKEEVQLPENIKEKVKETLISLTEKFKRLYFSNNASDERTMENLYQELKEIDQSLDRWPLIYELYKNGSSSLQKKERGSLSENLNKYFDETFTDLSDSLESHYSSIERSYINDCSIRESDEGKMEELYQDIKGRDDDLYRLHEIYELYKDGSSSLRRMERDPLPEDLHEILDRRSSSLDSHYSSIAVNYINNRSIRESDEKRMKKLCQDIKTLDEDLHLFAKPENWYSRIKE